MLTFFHGQSQCWWQVARSYYTSRTFRLILDQKDQYSGVNLVKKEKKKKERRTNRSWSIIQYGRTIAIRVSQHLQFSYYHWLHQKLQLLTPVSKRINRLCKVVVMWKASCKKRQPALLESNSKKVLVKFRYFSRYLQTTPSQHHTQSPNVLFPPCIISIICVSLLQQSFRILWYNSSLGTSM